MARRITASPLALVSFAIVASVAVGTRFWRLGEDNLWLDEIWSLEAAQMSLGDMVRWTSADIHPPLYYALLHPWIDVFGTSEAGIRSLSAAAGVVTIVLLFFAAPRAGGLLLATSAGLFLALNPAFLAISQEARMYALVGLFALSAAATLGYALERTSLPAFFAYAVFASAMIYTHYIGFFALALLTVTWAFFGISAQSRLNVRVLMYGAGSSVAIALAYLPWLDDMAEQATRDHSWDGHFPDPSLYTFMSTFRAAFGFQFLGDAWIVLLIPLLVLGGSYVIRNRENPYCLTLTALALVPLLQVFIAVVYQPLFDLKRVAPFTPGFAFLMGCAVVQLRSVLDSPFDSATWLSRLTRPIVAPIGAIALLVLIAGFDLRDQFSATPPEDWRQITESIAHDQQSAYTYRAYIGRYLHYYMGSDYSVNPIEERVLGLLDDGLIPVPRESTEPVSLVFAKSTDVDRRAIERSLQPFFDIQPEGDYGTVTRVILTPKSIARYNVALSPSGTWETTSDGYLTAQSDASFDIVAEEQQEPGPVTLVIESRSPVSVSAVGDRENRPLFKRERPLDGGWSESSFSLPTGQRSFRVSGGAVIRVLEARRYETQGVAVLRGEAPVARQWFLRGDGYLETAVDGPCVLVGSKASSVTFQVKTFGGWITQTFGRDPAEDVACIPGLRTGTVVRSIHASPATPR